MFNAMAQFRPNPRLAHIFKSIQHIAVGPVADGMDVDSQPGTRRLFHLRFEMFGGGDGNAKVIWLPFIGLNHQRRAGTQRPVGEHLQGTKAQPFIAQSTLNAHLNRGVEIRFRDLLQHAQLEFTLAVQRLEGAQGGRSLHVVDANDAHAMHCRHRHLDRGQRFLMGGHALQIPHQLHRPFEQNAGWLTGRPIAHDLAAGRVCCVGSDAGQR